MKSTVSQNFQPVVSSIGAMGGVFAGQGQAAMLFGARDRLIPFRF